MPERTGWWVLDTQPVTDLTTLQPYEGMLSPEEQRRACKHHHERRRVVYVMARCLLRWALSNTYGWRAEDLVVETQASGRPCLQGVCGVDDQLAISIAHTQRWVMVGWSLDGAIGVDIQVKQPRRSVLELANRYFDPGEASGLAELEGEARQAAWRQCWVRKEAVAKASERSTLEVFRTEPVFWPGANNVATAWLLGDYHSAKGWDAAFATASHAVSLPPLRNGDRWL